MNIVRKVTKAKWNNQLENNDSLNLIISADAITSCLRTTSNTLSIWKVENIDDAILALASVNDNIVPIDYIVLDDEFFESLGIEIKNVVSESNPVKDLREKHFDAINLDYCSLVLISEKIALNIVRDKQNYIKRCSTKKVKEILLTAIREHKLQLEDLNDKLQQKLK